jgi:hypothetical protein
VGRIEQKMLLMMAEFPTLLDGLASLLAGGPEEPPPPYEFGAGSYELVPVCDVGPDGEPAAPFVVSWAGGQGELLEIRRRVDGLAQLIQAHKIQRQPICRRSPPIGEEVTVNFWEVL